MNNTEEPINNTETEKPISSTPDLSNIPEISPTSKITKSLIIKIISGLVIIVILGGGVALATRAWDPLWSPFRSDPEKVIEKMYGSMKGLKSFHTELVYEMDGNTSTGAITVRLNNDSDKSDPNNAKSKGSIEILSGDSLSITFSYVIANKKMFFKIDNIPPFMGMDLSFFQGMWIEVGELGENNSELKSLENFIEEMKEALIFKEELKDEKVNGKKAYHYLFGINKERLKGLTQTDMIISSFLPADAIVGAAGSIDKQLENIKDLEIEYFIGKRDKRLYKISIDDEIEEESGKTPFSLEVTFSDFDKEMNIEAPEGARKIEEILQEIFGGFMGTEMIGIRDSINKLTPMFIR